MFLKSTLRFSVGGARASYYHNLYANNQIHTSKMHFISGRHRARQTGFGVGIK
jgi:hypothetical protein